MKTSRGRILVVEDRDSLRRMMELALRGEGYEVKSAPDVAAALALVATPSDLVITDLMLPDGSGLEVVRALRAAQSATPIVVLTAFGSIASAVEAMRLGAVDFLEKPLELEQLFALCARWIGPRVADPIFQPPGAAPAIVGCHPRLRAGLRLLEKVAPTPSTVLLTGESGTGKELFARAVHALSPRALGAFVAVNCAAIPESLMENELFGHEKGAFTGAERRHVGRFELAQGGTLFLDEIGELRPEVQGKVLRVLEERVFERVGGGQPVKADVRIVAATNRDLEKMATVGEFRQDLFYRLNVFPIELPPLRERADDVPALARHLVVRLAQKLDRPAPTLDADVLELLQRQPWPGNIRQLANLLERALILVDGHLSLAEIAPLLENRPAPVPGEASDERARVRAALAENEGDKNRAAASLGWSYRHLQRKIHELDLEGFPKYRDD
jgi:DNA-binding NtrC family response regulator